MEAPAEPNSGLCADSISGKSSATSSASPSLPFFASHRFSKRALEGDTLHDVTLPSGDGPGKSGVIPLCDIFTTFRIFHLNVNDFSSHAHLLDALVHMHEFPEFVAITETHLREDLREIHLSNYELVSRRDRQDARPIHEKGWGGVALFARSDVYQNIVFTKSSDDIEATWHTLHSDIGPILVGVWYRPPRRGEVASIKQFELELERQTDFVGKIIVGDMNVHNEQWLRFSNGTSPEGRELEQVCTSHGLKQRVKKPTRGDHLLDLVLTDMIGHVRCDVVPGILDRDHSATIATVSVSIPSAEPSHRQCFNLKKAHWNNLKKDYEDEHWGSLFHDTNADIAALALTSRILEIARKHIPMKTVSDRPYKHPWVDKQCCELLKAKHDAIGTPDFPRARDACTAGFLAARDRHVATTKKELREAPPKDWWRTSKQLLAQSGDKAGIPPLQSNDTWAKEPSAKADLLSKTFRDKARLPELVTNDFSPVDQCAHSLDGFLRIRVRTVLKILKELDEHSGTGPDELPSVLLRRCAAQLALPITLLARLCLSSGRWPLCWRRHWVHPLHKKKSRANPVNYRGVHLTAQLSKVVERSVGSTFVPWLSKHGYGEHQYAYSSNKSHRDVLAINVCSWLLLFEEGRAVGLYCSDVSGAFDRVDRDRLSAKLRASGLHPKVVVFLESWLEDRISNVIVAGASSVDEVLANSVFQGTVLGTCLWNLFYADARFAVRQLQFTETVFADDFNCWTALDKDVKELDAVIKLSECQHNLHAWGGANRVVFDPVKEEFVLMRRFRALGPNFRLLGITFDPQLLMHTGARKIAVEAGWRLQSILRPRRFFNPPELVRLYKSLVPSYVESGTPGYFHAAPSTLECIDRVQRRFLRAMNMTDEDALLNFRLAPLETRRDISILGMPHRVNLGLVSPQMQELFPRVGVRPVDRRSVASRVRSARSYHDRQLLDRVSATSTVQFRLSIFGMVQCYNALPQSIVNASSVKAFQRSLQLKLIDRVRGGYDDWQQIFTIGRRYASILRFQAFFHG